MFLCFKQKTAYDMRISDWSSDVCSSDLLQLLVALEDLLHADRAVVVRLADVLRVEDPRGRRQRVHGRVDTERGDLTRELGGRVQVGERRRRRRVDRKSVV